MRQIAKELRVENSFMGLGIGKLCLLCLMLFMGSCTKSCPYSILGLLLLVSLEMGTILKMHGQIDYILPQTAEEKKRNVLIKSALVAGIYSAANTCGYIVLVCSWQEYEWSLALVIFLVYMTLVMFLYFFSYRAGLFCVGRSQNIRIPEEKAEKRRWVRGIWLDGLACFLSIFSCLFYIIDQFGSGLPAVLTVHGKEMMLGFGGMALVLMLRMALTTVQKMDYSEYWE